MDSRDLSSVLHPESLPPSQKCLCIKTCITGGRLGKPDRRLDRFDHSSQMICEMEWNNDLLV